MRRCWWRLWGAKRLSRALTECAGHHPPGVGGYPLRCVHAEGTEAFVREIAGHDPGNLRMVEYVEGDTADAIVYDPSGHGGKRDEYAARWLDDIAHGAFIRYCDRLRRGDPPRARVALETRGGLYHAWFLPVADNGLPGVIEKIAVAGDEWVRTRLRW